MNTRLEVLKLVMENGAEADRRDPLEKANKLLAWVEEDKAKPPSKQKASKSQKPTADKATAPAK